MTDMVSFVTLKDTAERLSSAIEWIRAKTGRDLDPTRVEETRRFLDKAVEAFAENRQAAFLTPDNVVTFTEVVSFAAELITVCQSLADLDDAALAPKLSMVVDGPLLLQRENKVSAAIAARNIMFELVLAGTLCRSGFEVVLDLDADVTATRSRTRHYIECKRPQISNKVPSNISEARKKALNAMQGDNWDGPQCAVVALSAARLLPGPPRLVSVEKRSDIQAALDRISGDLIRRYRRDLDKRAARPGVGGALLHFDVCAVVREFGPIPIICNQLAVYVRQRQ